jgi:hypothetical protein
MFKDLLAPLTLIFIATFLCSCNKEGTLHLYKNATTQESHLPGNTLVFAGITAIDNQTDSTLRINWVPHAEALAYDVFDVTSGSLVWQMTVNGQSSASAPLSGLSPGALYKFLVRAKDSSWENDLNTNVVTVTMNTAPDAPSVLSLVSPNFSAGLVPRAVIQVGGLKSGDTVNLFTDNTCATQVASGVATGSTINLTTSVLTDGVYNFYASATNSASTASACSASSVTYTKISCPAGYIVVPANSTVGPSRDFCVMKFEAKDVGGVATSQAANTPWVQINMANAAAKCASFGANYDLISNPEWMAIAYNIESNGVNWTGASPGQGALYRGHTDNTPGNSLDITDVNDPYIGTGNSAPVTGKEQKRTLTLTNGEVIWDFSGNVWEWVDWSLSAGLTSGPTTCVGLTQLNVVNCAALTALDYMPSNPASVPWANYDSLFGLGFLNAGVGGGSMRGGNYSFGNSSSGIFSLSLNVAPTVSTSVGIGFRCVYRP